MVTLEFIGTVLKRVIPLCVFKRLYTEVGRVAGLLCWQHPTWLIPTLPGSPGIEEVREVWYGEQCESKCLRMRPQLSFTASLPRECSYRSLLSRAHRFHLDNPFRRHTASAGAHRRGSPGNWTCQPHRWWHLKPKEKMPFTLCLPIKIYHVHFF